MRKIVNRNFLDVTTIKLIQNDIATRNDIYSTIEDVLRSITNNRQPQFQE